MTGQQQQMSPHQKVSFGLVHSFCAPPAGAKRHSYVRRYTTAGVEIDSLSLESI